MPGPSHGLQGINQGSSIGNNFPPMIQNILKTLGSPQGKPIMPNMSMPQVPGVGNITTPPSQQPNSTEFSGQPGVPIGNTPSTNNYSDIGSGNFAKSTPQTPSYMANIFGRDAPLPYRGNQ